MTDRHSMFSRSPAAAVPPTGAERLTSVETAQAETNRTIQNMREDISTLTSEVNRLTYVVEQLLTIVPLNSPSDRAGRVKRIRQELDNNVR